MFMRPVRRVSQSACQRWCVSVRLARTAMLLCLECVGIMHMDTVKYVYTVAGMIDKVNNRYLVYSYHNSIAVHLCGHNT